MHTKQMRKIFEPKETIKGGVEAIEKDAKGAVQNSPHSNFRTDETAEFIHR